LTEFALTAIFVQSSKPAFSFLLLDFVSAIHTSEASNGRTAAMTGVEAAQPQYPVLILRD
jgi:hypothetical protein